jgi:hypothetical protein
MDLKFTRQNALSLTRRKSASNFDNLAVREFCVAIVLAASLTILTVSVAGIIPFGAEKKVIWSYAGANIAMMKDAESVRNCIVIEFPGVPMCSGRTRVSWPEDAVAIRRFSLSPNPAAILGLLDFRPKSLSCCETCVLPPWHLFDPSKQQRACQEAKFCLMSYAMRKEIS